MAGRRGHDPAGGDGSAQTRALRRSTFSQELANQLRSAILTGELAPGEYIRIDAVAAEFEVSATPVREALLTLQGYGFVEQEPNRGFRVVELTRDDIESVFLVQRFVAGELAARAATMLDEAGLERLGSLQSRITRAHETRDFAELDRLNDAFHRVINRAADAPKLGLFLAMALRYVPRAPESVPTGWQDATATDHSPILAALRDRDPDGSRAAMVAHIDHARRLLVEHRLRRPS